MIEVTVDIAGTIGKVNIDYLGEFEIGKATVVDADTVARFTELQGVSPEEAFKDNPYIKVSKVKGDLVRQPKKDEEN